VTGQARGPIVGSSPSAAIMRSLRRPIGARLMQAIDYTKLLESTAARVFVPLGATRDEAAYEGEQGIRFRSDGKQNLCCENVRLAEGAFLFVSRNSPGDILTYRQTVSESDWIHIQFRLLGCGWENINRTGVIQTPQGSCIVGRYPENCIIERTTDATNGWKTACLMVTPAALMRILDISASKLPYYVPWLVGERHAQPPTAVLPLQPAMVFAVNDILACTFRSYSRLAYMRGKSLELLSTVIHALAGSRPTASSTGRHSSTDLEKLALARTLICANLEANLTLSELARRVGVNRTKLALGFKAVYGHPVQAFWRDARLNRARQMLRDGAASVTEVALSVGYSQLSSFTHAFTRRFGIAPSECVAESRRALDPD
jgi:AraC family transcriptional activator of pyochelin receptor